MKAYRRRQRHIEDGAFNHRYDFYATEFYQLLFYSKLPDKSLKFQGLSSNPSAGRRPVQILGHHLSPAFINKLFPIAAKDAICRLDPRIVERAVVCTVYVPNISYSSGLRIRAWA